MLLTDLRILVTDTGRLCWRLLPRLLTIWLLGWLGQRLFSNLAVIAGDGSAWLTLILFPLSIVSELVAIVLILQVCGRELGTRSLIPTSELVQDDRDAGITQLLAITLLPFIGIYAAFGNINNAAYGLYVQQLARYGAVSDQQTVLGLLNDLATKHTWRLLAIIIALYVARRLLDALHERTEWRPLGLLVALVEAFFILLVVMGGIRVYQLAEFWVEDRAFARWLDVAIDPLRSMLAAITANLPQLLVSAADFVTATIWPALAEAVVQPLAWLAVAAIIFGSNVMSLAELNRTVRDQLPTRHRARSQQRTVRRVARREARVATTAAASGVRRVGAEAREAFLGDVDDKYLPTLHALRLVIRSGPLFLGSFVLSYAAIEILSNYLHTAVRWLLGGHQVDFWLTIDPLIDLVQTLPIELLRLCLLSVAFRRCLELFAQRSDVPSSDPSMSPATAPPPGSASPAADEDPVDRALEPVAP